MAGRLVRSRRSVSRKKEYIVKFYDMNTNEFLYATKTDDLMTLRQAEKHAMAFVCDGVYGVPAKVGE